MKKITSLEYNTVLFFLISNSEILSIISIFSLSFLLEFNKVEKTTTRRVDNWNNINYNMHMRLIKLQLFFSLGLADRLNKVYNF